MFLFLRNGQKKGKHKPADSKRVISSAVEHLVYTEAVGGSNPSSPTIFIFLLSVLFLMSSCGKKGPPEDFDDVKYPQTYPVRESQKKIERF